MGVSVCVMVDHHKFAQPGKWRGLTWLNLRKPDLGTISRHNSREKAPVKGVILPFVPRHFSEGETGIYQRINTGCPQLVNSPSSFVKPSFLRRVKWIIEYWYENGRRLKHPEWTQPWRWKVSHTVRQRLLHDLSWYFNLRTLNESQLKVDDLT